ncbi:ABC transporter substrate-binding protein [Synechococcus sp. Nb3U1]|uniref:ABC transporter substrate-binding protein n=1 Tax=Synechococcus sp. Nb3U1 TaxID=1914529 RepID=UPI001F3CDA16|nr:ABC transporter substrate-binding protein [Synechococcus sp. Nb3U1]MCF2971773.1 ABC transporter substrate-binding protein [Synechococcus sp. Nb3U1]
MLEKVTLAGWPSSRRAFLQQAVGFTVAGAMGWQSWPTAEAQTLQAANLQLAWIKNVEFAGQWAALEKGFFKEEGLDINILPGGGQIDPATVTASGTADIGITASATQLVAARSRGVPLIAFGSTYQKSPGCMVCRADSGIMSPKDFAGKKIGHQQTARSVVKTVLKINGIPEDQVEMIVVSFDPSPVMQGVVDLYTAFATNQPLTMKEQGIEPRVFLYYDMGLRFEADTFIATEATLERKPEVLEAFLRASLKGWEYTLQNPDEVAQFVVEKYGEGLSLTQQIAQNRAGLELMVSELTEEKGLFWMDPERWEQTNQVAVETEVIERPIDVSQLLVFELLEKVHGNT